MSFLDGQNPAQRRAALADGELPRNLEEALRELAEAVEILANRQFKHEKRIRALEEAQKDE